MRYIGVLLFNSIPEQQVKHWRFEADNIYPQENERIQEATFRVFLLWDNFR